MHSGGLYSVSLVEVVEVDIWSTHNIDVCLKSLFSCVCTAGTRDAFWGN